MASKATYKPLLFTTTVRNPRRMKALLNILSKYDGIILTNELTHTIMGDLIRYGLYRPTRGVTSSVVKKWGSKRISPNSTIGLSPLSPKEVKQLLNNNPQKHQEAGFERGWPSRFATVYDFAKELGFVYYWINEPIQFSKIGLKLANSIEIQLVENYITLSENHPELEQQAFLNALVKYHRNNPFVKVLNENIPLILLLKVIQKINKDPKSNKAGISKLELPLIIFWKNNDAESLYKLIKSIRQKYGYQPSWEVIVDVCVNQIMEGKFKKFKPESIMVEYPDEFIRKVRLTGLISLRGAGRFIDINTNEQEKVDYVLRTYDKYKSFHSVKEYFKYASQIDKNLISLPTRATPELDKDEFLKKWVKTFSWNTIKEELLGLQGKKLSTNEILKYLTNPIRLEFLTALAIKAKFPHIHVLPNYPIDDEGVPTSTAGGQGNLGDIECFENKNGILIEVTMSEGRTQTMMEIWPISRHLREFSKKIKSSMCFFVAPSIFEDSINQIEFVRQKENIEIYPQTISEFIDHLEQASVLYK